MGRKQDTCGAVTGGILVLGMRHGRGSRDDRTATEFTYRKTRDLMDAFAEKHGSCMCRQLVGGCDTSTEEGRQAFKDQDLLNKVCKACVRSIAEILEQMR